jgi:hypothetical protein
LTRAGYNFTTDHIDRHEQTQLAAEFIDWFLTGNSDGPLLRRKALSVESERDHRKAKRELRRAFEPMGGESVRLFAEEQYEHGRHRRRNQPRRVKLIGDPLRGRILLVDVKEVNGHTHNRQLEATTAGGRDRVL